MYTNPNPNENPTIKKIIKYAGKIAVLAICCFFFYDLGTKKAVINNIEDKKEQEEKETINWQEAYKNVLQTTYCPKDSIGNIYCTYYLYDIDKNEIPELLVKIGLTNEDFVTDIYTIKNNQVLKLEQIPMTDSEFAENNNTLIYNYTYSNYQKVYEITMNDYQLQQSKIVDAQNIETYNEYNNLPSKYITEYDLIDNY